ncbi:MAG: hypothetical protein FRX49_09937 [Trebouxia sp. A1-2]|nr:MAG: hypothetical protein FRX49_09937 [Trebouxia sp. A1-2]
MTTSVCALCYIQTTVITAQQLDSSNRSTLYNFEMQPAALRLHPGSIGRVKTLLQQKIEYISTCDAAPAAVGSKHPKQPAMHPGLLTHPAAPRDFPPLIILMYPLLNISLADQMSKFSGVALSDCFVFGRILPEEAPRYVCNGKGQNSSANGPVCQIPDTPDHGGLRGPSYQAKEDLHVTPIMEVASDSDPCQAEEEPNDCKRYVYIVPPSGAQACQSAAACNDDAGRDEPTPSQA